MELPELVAWYDHIARQWSEANADESTPPTVKECEQHDDRLALWAHDAAAAMRKLL